MAKKVKRLFEQFQPTRYKLHIKPDKQTMTFTGTVTIEGAKTGRPSQRITFHQKDLKVTSGKIIKHDKSGLKEVPVKRNNTQKSLDEVRLHTDELLYPGHYSVELSFSGKITRAMQGIYPCFFKHNDKDKIILATQFESHHAREAFPCIDEPEAKAVFELTVTAPAGETVLSNTEVASHKKLGTLIATAFEPTPKMSTYLLAFAIGEIHGIEAKSKNGVKVTSWASVAQNKTHLQYANDEAVKILDFFEDYFNVPFPLKKLDQIALPDFDSLAMENWGLITYREIGLLSDPKNISVMGRRLITQVIAHEMSHQWFGNLVTMKWWDDLWLNESFATIMESLAPNKLHPDWQEWEDFVSTRVLGAANRDVYKDVQPVGVPVNHPDEIQSLFDPMILYGKGGRILKMMFDFIGEDSLRKGLTNYFKKYAYKNTERSDLWAELGKSSGVDINKIMTPWIEQSGTPELEVKVAGGKLELSQKRFLLDGGGDKTIWPIPLLADSKIEPSILDKPSSSFKGNPDNIIFNPTGSGHYVVKYSSESLQRNLLKQIVTRKLDATGRIVGMNDLLLEVQRDQGGLSSVLDIVSQCGKEDRDAVWSVLLRTLGFAQLLTEDDASDELLRSFKRSLSEYWYERLGWDEISGDDVNIKQLQTTIVGLNVGAENPAAIKTALAQMAKAKKVENLPADFRGIVASAAVRFGESKYIDQFLKEYTSSHDSDVQSSICAALCSTHEEKVAKKLIKWGMYDDNIIRPQDIDHWFAYLMRNRYTRSVAWGWLMDRWPHLVELFGGGKKMEYFIWYSSRPISSTDWQQRYKKFFEPMLGDISMKRNLQIAFSEVDSRVAWRKRDEAKIKQWLAKNA